MLMTKLLLFGMLLVITSQAMATAVSPYTYDVSGQLSIVGNDGCTPSPCRETLDFSFGFAWVLPNEDGIYTADFLPGTAQIVGFGPLGENWTIVEGPFNSPYYIPLFDQSGNEIDLDMPNATLTTTPWIAPSFYAAELYGCQTANCVTDFVPSYLLGDPPSVSSSVTDIFLGGVVSYTTMPSGAVIAQSPVITPMVQPVPLVAVPEASTWLYLIVAVIGVFIARYLVMRSLK